MPQYTYTCTCPDFTQQHSGVLSSQGLSSSVSREWQNIKENPDMYCKHIIAVILRERDSYTVPTDVPTAPLTRSPLVAGEWADKNKKANKSYI
jgi:hypothetical protein